MRLCLEPPGPETPGGVSIILTKPLSWSTISEQLAASLAAGGDAGPAGALYTRLCHNAPGLLPNGATMQHASLTAELAS